MNKPPKNEPKYITYPEQSIDHWITAENLNMRNHGSKGINDVILECVRQLRERYTEPAPGRPKDYLHVLIIGPSEILSKPFEGYEFDDSDPKFIRVGNNIRVYIPDSESIKMDKVVITISHPEHKPVTFKHYKYSMHVEKPDPDTIVDRPALPSVFLTIND